MKAEVICFITQKEPWFEQAQEQYLEKIKHFQKFEIKRLPPLKRERADRLAKILHEKQVILKEVLKEDFLIVLTQEGHQYSSQNWVECLNKIEMSGKKRLVILIGGAFGIDEEIKKRADLKVSFGRHTMNHLIAQLVFLEQWYRAWTIKKGLPYHNPD